MLRRLWPLPHVAVMWKHWVAPRYLLLTALVLCSGAGGMYWLGTTAMISSSYPATLRCRGDVQFMVWGGKAPEETHVTEAEAMSADCMVVVEYGVDHQSGTWPFKEWVGCEYMRCELTTVSTRADPTYRDKEFMIARAAIRLQELPCARLAQVKPWSRRHFAVWSVILREGAYGVGALGLLVALAAGVQVRRTRSRRRRILNGVCPACTYELAGLDVARCPECGAPLTIYERGLLSRLRV